MIRLKKWQLITTQDVSPSQHFPLEKRGYKLPNGRMVDDFYVATIADSVNIIPITNNGQIIMIRMYKQGVDGFMIQFPGGRFDPKKHPTVKDTAIQELEEEAGIKINSDQLVFVGKLAVASTKATENSHIFIAKKAEFNSKQNLDDTEEIEVLVFSPKKVDQLINEGKIWCAITIAGWHLAKQKLQ